MGALLLALKYFPYVLEGVIAVQQSIGSQPGATKKQVALGAITAAAKVGGQVEEAHIAAISNLIDATVAELKAAGAFGKPPVQAAAA